MKSMMRRTTFREIKNTFGRFAAIMAIIALGVGFFSGLKMTKPDMVNTVSDFLSTSDFTICTLCPHWDLLMMMWKYLQGRMM